MATVKKSVYTRLINVRQKFNESGISKSGVNTGLEFLYLELVDIVPTATKLMQEEGLLSVVNFTEEVATMTIFNNDDPEDKILFSVPFVRMQPIVTKTGRQATNEIQALGSSVTYFRRYLYMIALDIAVPDEVDNDKPLKENTIVIQNANVYESKEQKQNKPATPIERQEIVKEMTKKDTTVSKETFETVKQLCVKLRKEHGEKYTNLITEISLGTKGFNQAGEETINKYLEALNEAIAKEEKGEDWVEVAKRQQAGN